MGRVKEGFVLDAWADIGEYSSSPIWDQVWEGFKEVL
jgi:hypothetical protein